MLEHTLATLLLHLLFQTRMGMHKRQKIVPANAQDLARAAGDYGSSFAHISGRIEQLNLPKVSIALKIRDRVLDALVVATAQCNRPLYKHVKSLGQLALRKKALVLVEGMPRGLCSEIVYLGESQVGAQRPPERMQCLYSFEFLLQRRHALHDFQECTARYSEEQRCCHTGGAGSKRAIREEFLSKNLALVQ
jgi:hypothetical protein